MKRTSVFFLNAVKAEFLFKAKATIYMNATLSQNGYGNKSQLRGSVERRVRRQVRKKYEKVRRTYQQMLTILNNYSKERGEIRKRP